MTNPPTETDQSEEPTTNASWPGRVLTWTNLAGGAAALAFGIGVLLASRAYEVRVGGLPGPGMYPRIVGWAIVVLAALWIIHSLQGRFIPDADTEPAPDSAALIRGAISLAAIVGYTFALRTAGYLLSSFVLVGVLVLLGRGSWRKATVTGAAFSAGSYLLVSTGLGVALPVGVLEPLLR